jgi:hypothetical protein
MPQDWIETEFSELKLGDPRREDRARIVLEQLSRVADSPPDACRGTNELAGMYRFVGNSNIQPDDILLAHHQASLHRTTEYDLVVLAQDTTVIDLTKPNRQVAGAGPIESNDKRGVFLHPLYAISESGVALGIVDQVIWTRDEIRTDLSDNEKRELRRNQAFEEKESCRWMDMLQSGEQIARAHPGTHYVNVADSECDICELYVESTSFPENYDFIIRGCHNRSVVASDEAEDAARNIDEALENSPFKFCTEATVSGRTSKIAGETRARRKSREARHAKIQVRACQVTVRGPDRPGGRLPDVVLNVVEAIEVDPPDGEEPIRWVLLTTMPIDSVKQIERIIGLYALRWNIELYFKTLKSGMRVEKLKYETLDRYLTAMSMLMIVAWRVEFIKGAARHDPDSSCEKYFSRDEWIPCYLVANQTREIPSVVPTTSEFLLLISELGGYLNKKGQGPPGSMTIWRGLRRLEAYAEAYQVFGKQNLTCVG